MERLFIERAFHPRISSLPYALTLTGLSRRTLQRCVMWCKSGRFVIGRESNVLRVDFSRGPDPPTPKFPGAAGLRETIDENTKAGEHTLAVASLP
jgi:hypothetical protein